MNNWTELACLQCHTEELPVPQATPGYGATQHNLVQVDNLPYPLLLRWNAPNFEKLIHWTMAPGVELVLVTEARGGAVKLTWPGAIPRRWKRRPRSSPALQPGRELDGYWEEDLPPAHVPDWPQISALWKQFMLMR